MEISTSFHTMRRYSVQLCVTQQRTDW